LWNEPAERGQADADLNPAVRGGAKRATGRPVQADRGRLETMVADRDLDRAGVEQHADHRWCGQEPVGHLRAALRPIGGVAADQIVQVGGGRIVANRQSGRHREQLRRHAGTVGAAVQVFRFHVRVRFPAGREMNGAERRLCQQD
jgi:hypothetical protein